MKSADLKNTDLRLVETRRLMILEFHLDANQSKNSPQVDHTLLLEHIKLFTNPSMGGGSHSFQSISPLWPPLPGKAIKATPFYFTQNSVSVSVQHW